MSCGKFGLLRLHGQDLGEGSNPPNNNNMNVRSMFSQYGSIRAVLGDGCQHRSEEFDIL